MGEVDLIPAQVHQLRDPQAVAVGNQDHRSVPMAPAVLAGCLDQLPDLGLGQVFAGPQLGIGRRRLGLTVRFSMAGVTSLRGDFLQWFQSRLMGDC